MLSSNFACHRMLPAQRVLRISWGGIAVLVDTISRSTRIYLVTTKSHSLMPIWDRAITEIPSSGLHQSVTVDVSYPSYTTLMIIHFSRHSPVDRFPILLRKKK